MEEEISETLQILCQEGMKEEDLATTTTIEQFLMGGEEVNIADFLMEILVV